MEIIKTKFGEFKLLKNYRDAFILEDFEKRYFPEIFEKYDYIVGDISESILRLKGFSLDHKSQFYYRNIPIYLNEVCNFNTAYYILMKNKDNAK